VVPKQWRNRFSLRAVGLVFLVSVLGCTVGPDYRKPVPAVPANWTEIERVGITTGPMEVVRWWTLFRDQELDSLIDRAVRSNNDLKLAEARIREARAQLKIAGSQAYPSVDVQGSYTRLGQSQNIIGGQAGAEYNLFLAGFDASWEVDLFGGVRRAVEAAQADLAGSEEGRRDVLVTLLGEVATNYLQVRGNQRRIAIAQENIKAEQQTVQLTRGRYEAGLGSILAVTQSEALLATTEAKVPPLEISVRQAVHRLGVLLGLQPEALLQELLKEGSIPPVPPEVPIGLPSELLRRRPDVRRAECELAAATARIGVATAALFPSFSLTGALGLQSTNLPNFLSASSRLWSIGGFLQWPLFDAGRIRAGIEVQNARQEQALISYENTVLVALEDVENAIVAYAKDQDTRRSLVGAVQASRQAVEISSELYVKGLVDFLNVLASQQSLYQAEDQLVQNEQGVSTDLVGLFKALGGGWDLRYAKEVGVHEGSFD
jgi:multidrug efflux system outer membrane protein